MSDSQARDTPASATSASATSVSGAHPIAYDRVIREVAAGPLRLKLEQVRDMNQTIDEVFKYLELVGKPELLEKLCPYFGTLWPSALALATRIAELPDEDIRDKRVLEVGCGLALPSLVAALRGARVVATDFHPEVPRFLERNIALNLAEAPGSLRYVEADWMAEGALESEDDRGPYDWVIGSDILYERHYPAPVAQALIKNAAPGATLILADPGRPYLQAFADEMKRLNRTVETNASGNIFLLISTNRG